MKSLLIQPQLRQCLVGMIAVLGVACGGCAVAGRSASMDSTSRMPWFNLELKPKKQQTSEPYNRSVRLDNKSDVRVAPASRSRGDAAATVTADTAGSPRLSLPVTEKNLLVDSNQDLAPDFR